MAKADNRPRSFESVAKAGIRQRGAAGWPPEGGTQCANGERVMLKRKLAAVCILFCLFSSSVVFAQADRGAGVKATGEKRLALVIGNGAYQNATVLDNPTNDATDMAKALQEVGFEVIGGGRDGLNLSQSQMETLIAQFGRRLAETKGTGLFYYAGHGVMSNGQNYLIPVDANIPDEDLIKYKAVSVGYVLDKMAAARNTFNLVILDACRNNPFARQWRTLRDVGDSKGLANSNPPRGTLVLYATQPGGTSIDGVGNSKNGLFTQALLKEIKKPNLELDPLVKLVAREVEAGSNQKQSPWKEGLYSGDFYFAGRTTASNNTGNNSNTVPNETPIVAKDSAAVEREAWSYVKESSDPQDFRSFLTDFPNGANAGNAKIKLEQAVWDAVKNSGDKGKLQGYLNEFPSGVNAPLAKIRIRQLDTAATNSNSNNSTTNTPTNPNLTSGSITAGTVITNSLGMKFAYSPAGTFQMGSTQSVDEGPVRTVSIGQGFYMGRTEVTQGQWEQVMGTTIGQQRDKAPKPERAKGVGEGADYPMYYVNWEEAKEYIQRLNARNDGYIYSLPTEAEWEYAARAGTTGDYGGNGSLDAMGWYRANSGKTAHPVGQKQPNAFGLYDMHGNLFEWCEDIVNDKGYAGSPTDGSANVSVGDSSKRVLRGGAWIGVADFARSADRVGSEPSVRLNYAGFRILAHLR